MFPLYIILGIYLISIVGVVIINKKRSIDQNIRILLNFFILLLLIFNFIYLNKFTSLAYVILVFLHILIVADSSYAKLYSHNKALFLSIKFNCSALYLTSLSLLLKPPVDYDQFSRTIGFIIWIFGTIIILVFAIKEMLEKVRNN